MGSITTSGVNINELHDFLITNLEGFHRVSLDSQGIDTADIDCGRVHQSENVITVLFADDLNIQDVQDGINKFRA